MSDIPRLIKQSKGFGCNCRAAFIRRFFGGLMTLSRTLQEQYVEGWTWALACVSMQVVGNVQLFNCS